MSEFLRDLLKKAKESADDLEAPPEEAQDQPLDQETEESISDISSEPGLVSKPAKRAKDGFKPSSPSKPGSPNKSGVSTGSGLVGKPDSSIKPPQTEHPHPKPGSPSKPGSPNKSGVSTGSGLVGKPDSSIKPPQTEHPHPKPGSPSKPGLTDESLPVQALRTFVTSQHALHDLLPDLKDSELRIYYYLVEQTHGNPDSSDDRVTEYSQRQAMKASGIKSTATIVKAMSVLVKRRLVKWVRRSRKRGQMSLVKVFLPDEPSTKKGRSED